MKSYSIGPSFIVLLGLVVPSAFATTISTNVINTGDYVISNATFVNQTYTDRDATKYTLMGLLSNPSNKSTEEVDIFIQAFNENNGLIGFSNSTLSNIIQSLQSKAELLRTLQSPFEISVDASNDDVFDHYELRIQ
jgi:citrate lyase synthetase